MCEFENRKTSFTPIGTLAEILDQFEADAKTSRRITRSSGGVIHLLHPEQLQNIILGNIHSNGMPNWTEIEGSLRSVANRAYKGKRLIIRQR